MIIYFGAGYSGNLASTLFLDGPSVGASGSIFGLLGCLLGYLCLNWAALDHPGSRRGEQLIFIGLFIVLSILQGLSTPNVDNFGHLGGLIGGFLLGIYCLPKIYPRGMYPPGEEPPKSTG